MDVKIGNKDLMTYVGFALLYLNSGENVVLKARGRSISRAVDVAEMLKRISGVEVSNIRIGTVNVSGRKLSEIEIELSPR